MCIRDRGIRLSLKLFVSTLEKAGIAIVDPLGEPFDPQLHEAMAMVPNPDAEPNAVMDVMFKKGFLNNVSKNGKYFISQLDKIKNKYPKVIKEVRGKGLLIGLCLHVNQAKFIQKLLDNNLLTVRAAENVVRLLPPLNVTKSEINLGLKIIEKVCKKF